MKNSEDFTEMMIELLINRLQERLTENEFINLYTVLSEKPNKFYNILKVKVKQIESIERRDL